jgi:O-antigen/teichoic acid export membrane protein
LGALSNVRQLYLFKQLEFKKLFYRDMIGQIAYALTAIGFAWFVQASAWALFAGYIAQYTAGIIVSYIIYPSRPALSFRFERLKDLFGFVKWVYGQEILDVILVQIDKIFVGRLLSPVELGVYAKAKDLASTATLTLASMMQKVGFAAFSQVQDRLDKVQEGFRKTVDVLFLTAVPIALLLLLEGGNIVSLLLGPKWTLIVVPLKIFAFGNLFYTFAIMVSPVLAALGRPDILFKMNMLRTVLMVPLMYIGIASGGISGLAWAIVGIWIVTLVYVVLYARPILRIPKRDFYPAIGIGGAACVAVLAADVVIRQFRPIIETGNLAKFVQVACLGIFYYFVIALVGRRMATGPYATLRSVLQEIGLKRFIRG